MRRFGVNYDLLVRRGQPGLAFGKHDTLKKVTQSVITVSRMTGAGLTKSPVDILDEHAAEVVRDRREPAHHEAPAFGRVMRDTTAHAC